MSKEFWEQGFSISAPAWPFAPPCCIESLCVISARRDPIALGLVVTHGDGEALREFPISLKVGDDAAWSREVGQWLEKVHAYEKEAESEK